MKVIHSVSVLTIPDGHPCTSNKGNILQHGIADLLTKQNSQKLFSMFIDQYLKFSWNLLQDQGVRGLTILQFVMWHFFSGGRKIQKKFYWYMQEECFVQSRISQSGNLLKCSV